MRSRKQSDRPRRRVRMALVAGVGALLALTAVAMGAGVKEKSTSFDLPAGEVAEGIVKCKKGQEAIAGGFAGDTEHVVPRDFVREGKRKWRLRSNNLNGSSPGEATVDAICAKDRLGLRAETFTRAVGQGASTVGAHCAGRREAVSGGFAIPGALGPIVYASHRDTRREWIVKVFSEDETFDVTAIVYCAKLDTHLKEKSATATLPNADTAPVTAQCRRGQRVLAGGFEGELTGSISELARTFASQRTGKRSWQVTGYGNIGMPDLTVYAYCQKKPKN